MPLDFAHASTATTWTTPTLVQPLAAAPVGSPAALRACEAFLARLARGEEALIEAPLPTTTLAGALRFVRQLYFDLPSLPAPTIAAGPDGMVGFTWENRRDHLNAQVFPDGRVELFHEDLLSRELWDAVVGPVPSDDFYERALRFCP
jgi:hypothetical protein